MCDKTRVEKGKEYFKQGYNCAQSVVLSFADLLELDEKTALKLSSSFGGGMGRLREVCGAVSGMFMVAGLLYGYDYPNTDSVSKSNHYALIQALAGKFKEKNGSIVCKQLLGLEGNDCSSKPSERTQEYYKKRPCVELVGDAIQIMQEYIENH